MPMTQMELAALTPGAKVKVTGNVGGHGYSIGLTYVIHRLSPPTHAVLANVGTPTVGLSTVIRFDQMEKVVLTRNEKIRYLKKERMEYAKKLAKAEYDLSIATKYKDGLDELADALATRLNAGIPLINRANLYAILRALGVPTTIERSTLTEEDEEPIDEAEG